MANHNRPTAEELRRHRVTFDARTVVDDGYGNEVSGSFAPVFSCQAAVRKGGGSEAVIAARLEGRQVLHVYVRASPETRAIRTDWRMRSSSFGVETIYAIDAVDAVSDENFVYCQVESGVAA